MKSRSCSRLPLYNGPLCISRVVSFRGRWSSFRLEVSLQIRVCTLVHICKKMHAWYRRSLVRDKITDVLGGWIGKLRLAEFIVKLSEFERNVYWRMGWMLKCLTGSCGTKGRKTSLVRGYCYVYGLICHEVGCGYPGLRLVADLSS